MWSFNKSKQKVFSIREIPMPYLSNMLSSALIKVTKDKYEQFFPQNKIDDENIYIDIVRYYERLKNDISENVFHNWVERLPKSILEEFIDEWENSVNSYLNDRS